MKHTGTCSVCGNQFTRNRPLRGTTCSAKCRGLLRKVEKIIQRCKHCGKEFSVERHSKVQFCSIACFNRSPFRGTTAKTPVIRKCERCGNDFKRNAGNTTQRFCSIVCRSVPKTEQQYSCEQCGKPCSKHVYANTKRKFCSTKCAAIFRNKAKRVAYAAANIWPDPKSAKASLLAEHCGCERCRWNAVPEVLELHHKDRNRKHNHLSNLELLCPNCHSVEHFKAKDGQFASNLGKS